MFDFNLFIYQVKMFIKQIRCKHDIWHYTQSEDFHIQTCKDCGKQVVERKIS